MLEMGGDGGGPAAIPVVVNDGERELGVGKIVVFASMNIKEFQAIISERIGVSPNQFSVYLAERRRRVGSMRIPITSRISFSAISRESGDKDWVFVVVLKRTRRGRRRKTTPHEMAPETTPPPSPRVPGNNLRLDPFANVKLLRRHDNSGALSNGFTHDNDFSGSVGSGRFGYDRRVRELLVQKDRYLMNMGLDPGSGLCSKGLNLGGERVVDYRERGGVLACEGCERAKAMGVVDEGEFHWCVNDPEVRVGFRTPAGPIARPVKTPN